MAALVLSRINSRSNSEKAANTPKINRPSGRVVSMAAPSPVSAFRPAPRAFRFSTIPTTPPSSGPAGRASRHADVAGLAGGKGGNQAEPVRRRARQPVVMHGSQPAARSASCCRAKV